MKNYILLALPFAAFVAGCDNDTPTNTPVDMAMMTTPPDLAMFVPPPKPALAATQIERMGRATINVAVTNPFDLDYTTQGGGANQNATRDMHSKDQDIANWRTKWTPIIARTLGIYDGVDRTCGNQFGACGMAVGCGGAAAAAGRYNTLAGVFADDQLYMDTTKTNCGFYLAVEATALQVAGANVFCGGRTPLVDTVDVMYTAASVGAGGFPTQVKPGFDITDGVAADAEGVDSLTAFPFLTAPN